MTSGQNKRIVFFGNERLVSGLESTNAPILSGLIALGYNVIAVVSHHSDSKSRNQRPLEVAAIAEKNNIPIYLPNDPSEIADELISLNPDIAVLVAYGRIISQSVIDIFANGIVNIHPSLLPHYRGPTPIESVILNGDKQTGVSIMQLSEGMDDGPVYIQRKLDDDIENDSKESLYKKMAALSTNLFFEVFPQILDESLHPQPQAEDTTYSKLIQKNDGTIDWTKPAVQIEREIRAYNSWPQSRTNLSGIDLIITSAYVEPEIEFSIIKPGEHRLDPTNKLRIGTSHGCIVPTSVKPLGKKEMPIGAFLSGYRSQLGI